MRTIELYTDGACSGNQFKQNIGGWAYLLLFENNKKTNSGKVYDTTNNQMEIMAVIKGLEAIKNIDYKIKVYSDSQYVISTLNEGWKKNKNLELWKELNKQILRFKDIEFIKVKGHSANRFNNLVDELAVKMTKELENE